ncbi:MAG: hypothetical protein IJK33_02510 [Clostridia bacterium]|nr:hypothetical protein [Selenomonadaceae bacterium]MBQ6182741.1 hypothetical protein [Clostridia bacterium]
MRKIKFRGVDSYNGKTVYGYYAPSGSIPMIDVGKGLVEIVPGSLAQLIGLDANKKEVYEGDKVQRLETGAVFRANFSDYDGILDGEIVKV